MYVNDYQLSITNDNKPHTTNNSKPTNSRNGEHPIPHTDDNQPEPANAESKYDLRLTIEWFIVCKLKYYAIYRQQ